MQWVFDKGRLLGDDTSHLSLVSSGADAIVARSNQELIDIELAEITEALPASRGATVRRAVVVREKRATFSLAPGQPPRPGTRTAVPGLFLAGDWLATSINGGSVEAAVEGGMQASQAICGVPEKIHGDDGGHAGKNNPWKVSKGFMAAGYAGAVIGAAAWTVTFGIEINNVEKAYQRGGTEAAVGEGIHAGARILGGYAGGALGANAGLATGPAAPIAIPAFTAAGGWAGSRFADGVVTGISQGLRALQARFGDQQLWGL